MRRRLMVSLALALLFAGGAYAHAAATAEPRPGGAAKARVAVKAGLLKVAADYLGVARKDLVAELRAGRSLAQVATARGKAVEGLEQALLAAVRANIDAAVAAGRIDTARAQRMRERAPARIDRLVNAVRPAKARGARVAVKGLLGVAADYLGVTRRELVTQLRRGQSLAQVATARGKSVDGLEQALLAAFRAKVDAAVAAGTIDAARAQRILERAPARIERLVNRTRR